MSFLVIGNERFALQIGENVLGGDAENAVPAEQLLSSMPAAVITVLPGTLATIRCVDDAHRVLVDGAALGTAPRKLGHGARLQIGGIRIGYGELSLVGRTAPAEEPISGEDRPLSAFDVQPNEPTADTGGRLTDAHSGAVHDVPAEGLLIGRDPGCQIVLASREVSREHALIAPSLLGYMITDRSLNGVLVNGSRVHGTQLLCQRDVIRIGTAELCFEADATTFEPTLGTDVAPAAYATGETETPQSPPTRELRASEPPTAELTPSKPLLASMEVLNGPMKGTRFRIERPSVQIGRGAHNDVRIPDESVSGSHATLIQSRAQWHLVDLGSKNGSYLDGRRAVSDTLFEGAVELRFGNVKLLFRPIARGTQEVKSTRKVVERRDVLAVEAQYLVEKAARVLGVDVPDVLEGASLPPKLSDDLLRRAPGRRASESAHLRHPGLVAQADRTCAARRRYRQS
jgi:pSer/pThr/pTyr-binding forkhead associated (FHA) protein